MDPTCTGSIFGYGGFVSSNYARAMIELRIDVELKDTILVVMPKLVGEGFFMCTIRVEYEWKPPRCLSFKVFGHVLDECPKKIISDVVKNLKNPRQATQGVQAGPKVGFKSVKQVYKPVSIKNGSNTSGKKSKLKCLVKIARGRQDIRTHAQTFGVPIAPPNANANHKDHASLSHDDSCSKSNVSDMV
nr:zinc knuckle CX2CX4HX4C [Tanacetum cinerariifolium]